MISDPRLPGETSPGSKPDISSAVWNKKMDAVEPAAPHLLNELARLLSLHKRTKFESIPRGIINILNYSWQDLADAMHLKRPKSIDKRRKFKGSPKLDEALSQEPVQGGRGAGASSSHLRGFSPRESKTQVKSERKRDTGWIIQLPLCDTRQRIRTCQWVLERLQAARGKKNLETAEGDLNKPVILRHYGDAKAKWKDKTAGTEPALLIHGIPHIPEVKQRDPGQKKLYYRINDGSSFVYYPSGCIAVCQSRSGLPRGGFYTNVFSDSDRPIILATITVSGHGAVTHPCSFAITAAWDQDGGFMCDHYGKITKEWNWQSDSTPQENIIIQLSSLISVELLSGTSATLSFKWNNESVQLPLSALPNMRSSEKMVSVFSRDPQMVRKEKEPSALWRRRGVVGRELKKIQRRVQSTVDGWMEFYRVAMGIKCHGTERMPDAPPKTRLRREVQSAALPSLNPPQQTDAGLVQPGESRYKLLELHRHQSAPAERPLDSLGKLPRDTQMHVVMPKKQTKEELCFMQIGPLRIHGNFKLEEDPFLSPPQIHFIQMSQLRACLTASQSPRSGIIPKSPVTRCPAQASFTPSIPLKVCPPLLRAALLREGKGKRCCCSATAMPVVTDVEYDAFIMGQPPHSQQILVVCLTLPISTGARFSQDMLEELYRSKNKHRRMPCTQCQTDSFRLVRYEMSTPKSSYGTDNILLQNRHNAAPGMVLMYIRGKLLSVGNICSIKDLQKLISRARGDYRLGLSLPPDYKFSETGNASTSAKDTTPTGGNDITAAASVQIEKTNEIAKDQDAGISHQ